MRERVVSVAYIPMYIQFMIDVDENILSAAESATNAILWRFCLVDGRRWYNDPFMNVNTNRRIVHSTETRLRKTFTRTFSKPRFRTSQLCPDLTKSKRLSFTDHRSSFSFVCLYLDVIQTDICLGFFFSPLRKFTSTSAPEKPDPSSALTLLPCHV